jgi:beta-mannanase
VVKNDNSWRNSSFNDHIYDYFQLRSKEMDITIIVEVILLAAIIYAAITDMVRTSHVHKLLLEIKEKLDKKHRITIEPVTGNICVYPDASYNPSDYEDDSVDDEDDSSDGDSSKDNSINGDSTEDDSTESKNEKCTVTITF